MHTTLLAPTHSAFSRDGHRLFHRCLTTAAGVGLLVLAVLMLAPVRRLVLTRLDQVPERFARLVTREPVRPAPKPAAPAASVQAPATASTPEPAAPITPSRRRDRESALAPGQGTVGRARAERLARDLAQSGAAMDRSLANLDAALAASDGGSGAPTTVRVGRRGRGVAGGRGVTELGNAALAGAPAAGSGVEGSAIGGGWVAIGSLGGGPGGSGEGAGDRPAEGGAAGGSGGAAPGVHRSNASLLAVIQRYAAGIQYCYANELKRTPGLRGKLIVAMTVAASGAVTEVSVVGNTTGSDRLAGCALGQIREWRFPAIREGATTFQTPFVFTPPE